MNVIFIDHTTQLVFAGAKNGSDVYKEVLHGWDTGDDLRVPAGSDETTVITRYMEKVPAAAV